MKKMHAALAVSVSLGALSMPAYAQDASPQEGASAAGGTIIVTARRKDEDIQDVPLNIQAVGGDDLKKLEIRQFADITAAVPGLSLEANNQSFGRRASIRGLDFSSNASGSAASVEFYRNDSPITPGALFQALYDIGQIEVLRGPQGTLKGRASPSGSISLTTRRPDLYEAGGYMSGSYAEHGRWSTEGAFNVPLIEDKLAVRVAGFIGESEASGVHGLNLKTGRIDKNTFDNTEAVRASVRADPFDGVLLLDFNYEVINNKNRFFGSGEFRQVESFRNVNGAAGASPVTIRPKDDLSVGAAAGTSNSKYTIFNWQAQLNLFGQSLTYVGSQVDGDIISYAPDDVAGLLATDVAANGVQFGQTAFSIPDHFTKTHEVRLQNQDRIGGIFDYVIGGLFSKQGTSTDIVRVVASGGDPVSGALALSVRLPVYRFRIAKENSLFANLTAHIGDRLEISGGVRKIKSGQDSGVATGATLASGSQPFLNPDLSTFTDGVANHRCYGYRGGVSLKFKSTYDYANCDPVRKATIYSASAKYNVTDNLMVYASYGTSWRPGNSVIGYRGVQGAFVNQFLELANEKSKSIEGGFKSRWLDDKLTFNLTVYRQTFKNFPYRLSTPILSTAAPGSNALTAGFQFVVPTDPKITGFEAEFAFAPSDNFNLGAILSYANGKIKNAAVPCVDLNDDNVQDQSPPSGDALLAHVGNNQVDICSTNLTSSIAPKWQGSVNGEFSQPFSDNLDGFLRGLVTWKGSSVGDLANQFDQTKSYALVNLYAGLRDPDGAWDVTLFAKNLTDTRRVTARTGVAQSTVLGGRAVDSTQYVGINVTEPRQFGVSARIAFGSR